MADPDDNHKGGDRIVVVDRRYKTIVDEGKPLEDARKPDVVLPPAPAKTPPPQPSSARTASPSPAPPPGYPSRAGDVTFENFIRSLYTQAMIQLGLVDNPLAQDVEPDLDGARQTIDILDLLREKTKGNLLRTEEKMITEALTAARLAYVETSKRRRR